MKVEDFLVSLYEEDCESDTGRLMACDSTSCFTNCTSGGCFCQSD